MVTKNLLFSAAVGLFVCTACGASKAEKASEVQINSTDSLDTKIEKLRKKRDYIKARIYEESDESMRTEFNANWEDYRGHLSKQEFFDQQLKQIDAELEALQQQKQKSK